MAPEPERTPVEDDPHAESRRIWWVYLCIPVCVFLAHLLLDNKLHDVPLWMRLTGSGASALLVWAILKWTGLVKRIALDPVLSGAFLVFLGALFGMQLPAVINASAPSTDWEQEAELPVLGVVDRGIKIPVPTRGNKGVHGGTTELVVVTRTPHPPHERIRVAVDNVEVARRLGCVRVSVPKGLLGFATPATALAIPCDAARGVPGREIEWAGRAFADWRWIDQPAGSSSELSP
jgi:hypothetical protein